jgi:hypothetical protein
MKPTAFRITIPCLVASVLAASGPLSAQGGLDPGAPGIPDCVTLCEGRMIERCVAPDGTIDPQCAEDAKRDFDFEGCVRDCEAQNGGFDPEVVACQGSCFDVYANALSGCVDATTQEIDADCVVASDTAFVECFVACGDVPWLPDLGACAAPCVETYETAAAACEGSPDGNGLTCFRNERAAFGSCLGSCGLWLIAIDDLCTRRCETEFQAALDACGLEPNGGLIDPADQECVTNAHLAFQSCLEGCGIVIPDEIRCASECDEALKVRLADCQGDLECEQAALANYSGCLEGCGIVVPPIPEPDPCLSRCDLAYQESVRSCYDPATGVVDAECLRQVDASYLACLEGCGIILPEPPPDGNGCTAACDLAYRLSIEKCFTVTDPANGLVDVDQECAAAADAAYLVCLEGCGVQPEPLPGDPAFPGGACDQACGAEILDKLFDCAAENGGAVNADCLVAAGNAFNDCLAGCQDQAGERVLGALARSASQPFLRGDADRNGTIEITDAIQVLSFLFLGGATPACEDAADGNDDGVLNLTDAIAILRSLFLGSGPLPAPAASPGLDPTPDGLGCAGG